MKTDKRWKRVEDISFLSKILNTLQWSIKSDLPCFFSQLEALYSAGIPVMRSLTILSEQTSNKKLATVLQQVRKNIKGGASFSRSIAKFPLVFNSLEVGVIRVGEAVGDLGIVLKKLTEFKTRENNLAIKIKSALVYPFLLFLCLLAFIFFFSQILFKSIVPLIKNQGLTLNVGTRVLIFVMDCLHNPLVIVAFFISIAGIWFFLRDFFRSYSFKQARDKFIWRIPLIGRMFKTIAMARFCYAVSFLYDNGIALLKVLAIAVDHCENTLLKRALLQSINYLKEGQPFWKSLSNSGIFPSLLIQMVRVGESSGKISECLKKLANFYEMDVSLSIEKASAALEPVMILIMGIFVGCIIFVVISPLYQLIESFGF